jgi:hypothetical protein
MFGRKIVVVGTPGVPQGAAGAAAAVSLAGAAVAASAGRGALASGSASRQANRTAAFLTAASMREVLSVKVLAA